MKKKKILIVDDEAIFAKAMEKALSRDFEVVTAINGEDGLQLARQEKPKLILLDILMPGIDGLEVLRRLKQDRGTKNIPVALLTNVDKDESVSEGIALGARGYLIKGDYSLEEVIEKVRSFV